jgi:hypothetical protein
MSVPRNIRHITAFLFVLNSLLSLSARVRLMKYHVSYGI